MAPDTPDTPRCGPIGESSSAALGCRVRGRGGFGVRRPLRGALDLPQDEGPPALASARGGCVSRAGRQGRGEVGVREGLMGAGPRQGAPPLTSAITASPTHSARTGNLPDRRTRTSDTVKESPCAVRSRAAPGRGTGIRSPAADHRVFTAALTGIRGQGYHVSYAYGSASDSYGVVACA
jgi:hypothetical protein